MWSRGQPIRPELGLRGFALPRLQARTPPFRASLIIGVLWGAWHLPVLVTGDPVSIVLFLVLALGLSFVFTLMFNGSGGSLIPGLLFHATVNWEEGFEALMPGLIGTDWEIWSTLALLLVGLAAAVLIARRPLSGQTHLAPVSDLPRVGVAPESQASPPDRGTPTCPAGLDRLGQVGSIRSSMTGSGADLLPC